MFDLKLTKLFMLNVDRKSRGAGVRNEMQIANDILSVISYEFYTDRLTASCVRANAMRNYQGNNACAVRPGFEEIGWSRGQ